MVMSRSGWVDALKGVAIILVVFGHTIGGLVASAFLPDNESEALKSLYRWIYSFHMPVFMIASGLFAYSSLEKLRIRLFIMDKLGSLIYPYFVWGILTWICHNAAKSWTNSQPNPTVPLQLIYNPAVGPWFLYVLAVLMVAFAGWTWLGGSRMAFFLFWVAVYFAGALRSYYEWPALFIRLSELGLWFSLGVLYSNLILSTAEKTGWAGLVCLFVFGFCVQTFAFMQRWDQDLILAIVPAFFGSLGLFAFAVLVERFTVGSFFEVCGRASLEIYVAGGLAETPARIVLRRAFGIRNLVIHMFCGTFAGIAWPLLLKAVCQKAGWESLFRCGILSKVRSRDSGPVVALNTALDNQSTKVIDGV